MSSGCSLRSAVVERGGHRLLNGVTLDVPRGTAVVLAGPNGSGKTTVLRVLSGTMPLSEGEGHVLDELLPLSARTRSRVSATLDEPQLWSWMTAPATLRTVCDLAGQPRPHATALLHEVGLDESLLGRGHRKRVRRFSQGMRKRLQVACALAIPADILLLDEPTSTLDEAGGALIWAALRNRLQRGVTVIVASHDRAAVDLPGAQLVRLESGNIVEVGSHA